MQVRANASICALLLLGLFGATLSVSSAPLQPHPIGKSNTHLLLQKAGVTTAHPGTLRAGRLSQADERENELRQADKAVARYGGLGLVILMLGLGAHILWGDRAQPVASGNAPDFVGFRGANYLLATAFVVVVASMAVTGLVLMYSAGLLTAAFGYTSAKVLESLCRLAHFWAAAALLALSIAMWVARRARALRTSRVNTKQSANKVASAPTAAPPRAIIWFYVLILAALFLTGLTLHNPVKFPVFAVVGDTLNSVGVGLADMPSIAVQFALASLIHKSLAIILLCFGLVHTYWRTRASLAARNSARKTLGA